MERYRVVYGLAFPFGYNWKLQRSFRLFGNHIFWFRIKWSPYFSSINYVFNKLEEKQKTKQKEM